MQRSLRLSKIVQLAVACPEGAKKMHPKCRAKQGVQRKTRASEMQRSGVWRCGGALCKVGASGERSAMGCKEETKIVVKYSQAG